MKVTIFNTIRIPSDLLVDEWLSEKELHEQHIRVIQQIESNRESRHLLERNFELEGFFYYLPLDIIYHILSYMGVEDIALRVALINSKFTHWIETSSIPWSTLLNNHQITPHEGFECKKCTFIFEYLYLGIAWNPDNKHQNIVLSNDNRTATNLTGGWCCVLLGNGLSEARTHKFSFIIKKKGKDFGSWMIGVVNLHIHKTFYENYYPGVGSTGLTKNSTSVSLYQSHAGEVDAIVKLVVDMKKGQVAYYLDHEMLGVRSLPRKMNEQIGVIASLCGSVQVSIVRNK